MERILCKLLLQPDYQLLAERSAQINPKAFESEFKILLTIKKLGMEL
jgi:hypothetical protein